MVTQITTLTLPNAPDLADAEFAFERSRNEAVRSANDALIREQFPEHWTVVYEGGRFAAFDDPQEFLAFLKDLNPFVSDSASARPPWPLSMLYAPSRRTSDLTDAALAEQQENRSFWKAHGKQLATDHPHNWIVVYGGGKVATPADQREFWVLRDSFDSLAWKLCLWSSPRRPLNRWRAHVPDRRGGK